MDKTKREMLRVALQLVAENVYKLEKEKVDDKYIVLRITTHFLWPDGPYGKIVTEPSVQMNEDGFLALFGDDTEYEYVADKDGSVEMQTRLNGVLFYALVH